MKKRVLSLLLCILMVLPLMLTSCGSGTDPDDTTTEEDLYVKPATLNFYIIGDKFNEESVAMMQAAFNERAMKLYKTKVEFVFCTEEKYSQTLLDDLLTVSNVSGSTAAKKFEDAEVVTTDDEFNTLVEIYPEIYNNQIDIMLINSKDLYDALKANDYLADLTDLLDTKFRDISQRVNGNLIKGATDRGRMYAVPNNTLIGTYKYVAVHKEIAYLLNYDDTASDFMAPKSENDLKQLLDYSKLLTLARNIQASKEAAPDTELGGIYNRIKDAVGTDNIYAMSGPFDFPTLAYYPKGGENTLLGVVYDYDSTYTNSVTLENILNNKFYKAHLELMTEAKTEGYYTNNAPEDAVYAIKYFEGSYTERFAYEGTNGDGDYFVFEVDRPRLEDDGAFNAMFAVSKYSASTERAMEIISALVADEGAELRNILLYGVEGEGKHFTLDETGNVIPTTSAKDNYKMNVNYTGNVVTAFPCKEYGRDQSYAEYFKKQNDAATRNPLYGMSPDKLWADTLEFMVDEIRCSLIPKKITEEINALDKNSPILKGESDPAAKKKKLIDNIPNNSEGMYTNTEMISQYRTYWAMIRAGIDPTLTYDEEPSIPSSVSLTITSELTKMKSAETPKAEAFLQGAADLASGLMNRALACTTVEQLNAIYAEISALEKNPTGDGKYFYAPYKAGSYTGMLNSNYDCTLAGALKYWHSTIS